MCVHVNVAVPLPICSVGLRKCRGVVRYKSLEELFFINLVRINIETIAKTALAKLSY